MLSFLDRFRRGIIALIFTLSLIVRLPYFIQYPIFRPDELGENIRGWAIVNYSYLPLTNNAPFIGALYNYLVAIVYIIVPSITSLRLLVVVFGSLTPPLLYFLTRRLAGSSVEALLASIILALSPAHILISSHVAWSASLSPFFLTLSLYFLIRGFNNYNRLCWFIFGVTCGLALQTHPSTMASYIAFLVAYTVLYEKTFFKNVLRNVKYWLPGVSLGYLNMIIYNVIQPLGSIVAVFKAPWTGLHGSLTALEFTRRFTFLATEYTTMFIAGIPIITLTYLVKNVFFYLVITILILTVSYGAFKDKLARTLLFYMLISLVILSLGTRGAMAMNIFGFTWGPHYLQQLLPLTSILIARSLIKTYKGLNRFKPILVKIPYIVIIALLIATPFTTLIHVYSYVNRRECTNQIFLEVVFNIKKKLEENTPIYIHVASRNPAIYIFYQLSILEGLNTYPKPKSIVERQYEELNLTKLIEDVNTTYLVLILPLSSSISILRKVDVEKLLVVKGCNQVPLFKMLIVKPRLPNSSISIKQIGAFTSRS